MALYSQLNARNIVTQITESNVYRNPIKDLQGRYGGVWIEHEVNGTYGTIGKKYSLEHDIFIEASKPVDHDGDVCNSWTLNTTTGRYDPPFAAPAYTVEDDDSGLFYYWDESAYQADTSDPKTAGWVKKTISELRLDHGTCYDENGNPFDCRHWL